MNLKKITDVVLFPTQNRSNPNNLYRSSGKLHFNVLYPEMYKDNEIFSLYFLSDDKPLAGDWYYQKISALNGYLSGIARLTQEDIDSGLYEKIKDYIKKVIATNDGSLEYKKQMVGGFMTSLSFPEPSPQFIKKYISEYNRGNFINRVMVEFELIPFSPVAPNRERGERIKVDSNNCITITKLKDSWSKEEVIKLFEKFELDRSQFYPKDASEILPLEQWIKDNL